MSYGIEQQIASVEREIKLRIRVYPRLIDKGKITALTAEREIATMRAVLETLQQVKDRQA